MKLLGLDIGDRRVGVAFGDTDLRIATPLQVIERASIAQDVATIRRLVHEYTVEQVVVGLPKNTDGTEGIQANATMNYSAILKKEIDVPMVLWNEHLSTVEAERRTNESGSRGARSRRKLDAIAAAVILQDYIDTLFNKSQNAD